MKMSFKVWFVTSLAMISHSPSVVAQTGPFFDADGNEIGYLQQPDLDTIFEEEVPNALDPSFIYGPNGATDVDTPGKRSYVINVGEAVQETGIRDQRDCDEFCNKLPTKIWGYGINKQYTWPGRTFEVWSTLSSNGNETQVLWKNALRDKNLPINMHIVRNFTGDVDVIDTSLHWAFDLPGYEQYKVSDVGIPIVPHVHGGHTEFESDGNPEFFFTPNWKIQGPQWERRQYNYANDQPAGTVWYHDHALGITRLNVYAGMAGFYIIRDDHDSGEGNPLNLPAGKYEWGLAIQDRFFRDNGELFYPAFPNDPDYNGFIFGEGVVLPEDKFPDGGPSALAEFFGDHMIVNGKIWPTMQVEKTKYRLRLLNGCDSRFLVIQFRLAGTGLEAKSPTGEPISFDIIGSDQGLYPEVLQNKKSLVVETGSRYDIIFDFSDYEIGNRIIMENLGGDTPFGGEIPGETVYDYTNLTMAFDVNAMVDTPNTFDPDTDWPTGDDTLNPFIYKYIDDEDIDRIRQVALFEGNDEYGRLQPLLGTAQPATDYEDAILSWPDDSDSCPNCMAYPDAEDCKDCPYYANGLAGQQIEGTAAWHDCTTENPALGDVEEWWIWNVSADAHPIHLHLVHFEIVGRHDIFWDTALGDPEDEDFERVLGPEQEADENGIYLENQAVIQHNKKVGKGYKINFGACHEDYSGCYDPDEAMVPDAFQDRDATRKDVVTALPNQVTRIRAKFDKPGRYVWHCHILSHEDHEMMRVLYVGEGDPNQEHCRMV